jgi:hypothetical protein
VRRFTNVFGVAEQSRRDLSSSLVVWGRPQPVVAAAPGLPGVSQSCANPTISGVQWRADVTKL